MNAFLHARTAFGFEYLISFRAEHSDDEILQESKDFFSGIDTKNKERIVPKIQSWRNKWTRFLIFSRHRAELVGRKLEVAPNRMFQQLTEKRKRKTNNFTCVSPLKKKPFAAQDLRVMLQRAGNYTPETKLDTSLLHSHQTL